LFPAHERAARPLTQSVAAMVADCQPYIKEKTVNQNTIRLALFVAAAIANVLVSLADMKKGA